MISFNDAFVQAYLDAQRRREEKEKDDLKLWSLLKGNAEAQESDNPIKLYKGDNRLWDLRPADGGPWPRQADGPSQTMEYRPDRLGDDPRLWVQTMEDRRGDSGLGRLYPNVSDIEMGQQQRHKNLESSGDNWGSAAGDARELEASLNELQPGTVNNQIQSYGQLHDTLKRLRNEHTGLLGKGGWYGNDQSDALNTLTTHDGTIGRVSSEIGIPKELLQATLFREQIFYSPPDATDSARMRSGISDNPSLGLGQVTPRTAIQAEAATREREGIPKDAIKPFVMPEMGSRLQDPATNIYYTAMVLANEAEKLKIDLNNAGKEEIEKVLTAYNGSGDAAQRYGRETYQYYDAFKRKNKLSYTD